MFSNLKISSDVNIKIPSAFQSIYQYLQTIYENHRTLILSSLVVIVFLIVVLSVYLFYKYRHFVRLKQEHLEECFQPNTTEIEKNQNELKNINENNKGTKDKNNIDNKATTDDEYEKRPVSRILSSQELKSSQELANRLHEQIIVQDFDETSGEKDTLLKEMLEKSVPIIIRNFHESFLIPLATQQKEIYRRTISLPTVDYAHDLFQKDNNEARNEDAKNKRVPTIIVNRGHPSNGPMGVQLFLKDEQRQQDSLYSLIALHPGCAMIFPCNYTKAARVLGQEIVEHKKNIDETSRENGNFKKDKTISDILDEQEGQQGGLSQHNGQQINAVHDAVHDDVSANKELKIQTSVNSHLDELELFEIYL